MHLFTYGTLMIPEIMHAVTGRTFACRSALLPDFARFTVRRETYPAIVPEIGADTSGTVYLDVDPASMERVDAFEGAEYKRETVKLVLEGGRWLEAETYVLAPAFHDRLSPQAWELEAFRKHHLHRFMGDFTRSKSV